MVNHRTGTEHDFKAGIFQTPAKIYFLHVCEKVIVEPSKTMIQFSPYKQAGASCPKDLCFLIVLAVVFFNFLENAATTERIAIVINKTAGSAGVLKMSAVVVSQQFRLAGCNPAIGIHHGYHRFDPIGCDFNIGIQQYVIFTS